MAKKVAVMAFNPVNGFGLFQYLETFFENHIPYKTFAVADKKQIMTNSGLPLITDDTITNLKGHEDEYDALVFACGDALPQFRENANKKYNKKMIEVIKTFAEKGKMLIGHCAAAMIFDEAGIIDGKRIAIHPLAQSAIKKGNATDEPFEIDGNIYTAQTENTIWTMMPILIKELKK